MIYTCMYRVTHWFVSDLALSPPAVPVDLDCFTAISDILVTTLRIGQPRAKMFLGIC